MIKWFQNETVSEVKMTTITVKNIPDNLYEALKMRAKLNRRSVNSEIIHTLEKTLLPRPIDVDAFLDEISQLREKTAAYPLNDELLNQMKNEGRP
jgi:plasmid stability protein